MLLLAQPGKHSDNFMEPIVNHILYTRISVDIISNIGLLVVLFHTVLGYKGGTRSFGCNLLSIVDREKIIPVSLSTVNHPKYG